MWIRAVVVALLALALWSWLGWLRPYLKESEEVQVQIDELRNKLFPDGSPATPDEFRKRFNEYVEQLLKGRDAAKVRIVIG